MRIILEACEAEIVEKKSRFIANMAMVNSEEEALEFIEKVKKNTMMPDITVMPIS